MSNAGVGIKRDASVPKHGILKVKSVSNIYAIVVITTSRELAIYVTINMTRERICVRIYL